MKHRFFRVLFVALAWYIICDVPIAASENGGYIRKWNTRGHRILDLESIVAPVSDDCYRLLDQLIGDSIAEIKYDSTINDPDKQIEQALKVFSAIASVFDKHGFRLHVPTHALSDAFTPHQDSDGTTFYEYDCDTSSFIYLSIAEMLNFPLYFIEVPNPGLGMNHNFVRWDPGTGIYIDWDTNGKYQRPSANPDGIYASNYDERRLNAYLLYCQGLSWKKAGKTPFEIQAYREAILVDPSSPHSMNNMAWLYVSLKEAQSLISGKEALEMALAAVKIDRDPNLLDTLACVHAELGDFPMAVFLQKEVVEISSNSDFSAHLNGFLEGKTHLQQQEAEERDDNLNSEEGLKQEKNTEANSFISLP